jgi:hypothetical protein
MNCAAAHEGQFNSWRSEASRIHEAFGFNSCNRRLQIIKIKKLDTSWGFFLVMCPFLLVDGQRSVDSCFFCLENTEKAWYNEVGKASFILKSGAKYVSVSKRAGLRMRKST